MIPKCFPKQGAKSERATNWDTRVGTGFLRLLTVFLEEKFLKSGVLNRQVLYLLASQRFHYLIH